MPMTLLQASQIGSPNPAPIPSLALSAGPMPSCTGQKGEAAVPGAGCFVTTRLNRPESKHIPPAHPKSFTGSPCKCLSWRQLQASPALRDPTVTSLCVQLSLRYQALGAASRTALAVMDAMAKALQSSSRTGAVWPSPRQLCGSPCQAVGMYSSSGTVPIQHHHVLAGGRHLWTPFPHSLPPRGQQDLAPDSRRAPGLRWAGRSSPQRASGARASFHGPRATQVGSTSA